MLCRIVSSFNGTVWYRFVQLILHDPVRCSQAPGTRRRQLKRFEETLSRRYHRTKGTFEFPVFFPLLHNRTHTTQPRPSGNGTVPGAQGCTALGTGSFRGSTAANFFPRRWGHVHATENIRNRRRLEIISCDNISKRRESSFELCLEDIDIPQVTSMIRGNFLCRSHVANVISHNA